MLIEYEVHKPNGRGRGYSGAGRGAVEGWGECVRSGFVSRREGGGRGSAVGERSVGRER